MIQISVFHTRNDRFTRLEAGSLPMSIWPMSRREMHDVTDLIVKVVSMNAFLPR